MNQPNISPFPNISLSHFEIYVEDVESMVAFYTRALGFIVTDRGEGKNGMVFLSRNPNEHHQLVLTPKKSATKIVSPIDHISFRLDGLNDLRLFHQALFAYPAQVQTVSHGNTWSVYFHDPENNRLELFTDTPWHVDQPCRFEVDLELSNQDLIKFTRQQIEQLPGFSEAQQWQASHEQLFTD